MILYLETSRLVKLYVREPDSGEVREAVGSADVVATSIVAYAEARAAFARKLRERGLSKEAHDSVKVSLAADWPRFFVLNVTGTTVAAAGDLAERHALRGFDALHLAAALDLRSAAGGSPVTFSTADQRLAAAARLEGLDLSDT